MPRKPSPTAPPAPVRVSVAPALQLAHQGFNSPDPKVRAAADTLMSALVVQLRNPEATLPAEVAPHLQLLLESTRKP